MAAKHWQEAQEEARAKNGANIVVSQDAQERDVVLVGNPVLGWRIVTTEGCMGAQTAQGVECILEELDLPHLGWH